MTLDSGPGATAAGSAAGVPPGAAASPENARLLDVVTATLVALGIAVRLLLWIHDRSLYNDEAAVAANLLRRGWLQVLQPLDIYQTAAPGFLLGVKLFGSLSAWGELGLRAIPAFASVTAIPTVVWLARRIGGQRMSVWTAALMACAPVHAWYATELKPYSLDALLAALVLAAGLRALGAESDRGDIVRAGLVATAAVFFSQGVVFLVAGIWGLLVIRHIGRSGSTAVLAASTIPWIAVFGGAYLATYDDPSIRAYMQWFYWDDPPVSPVGSFRTFLGTGLHAIVSAQLVSDAAWQPPGAVALGALLVSVGVVWRSRGAWHVLALSAAPAALLAAAAVGLFPLSPRLTLVALPGVILLLSECLAGLPVPTRLHGLLASATAALGATALRPPDVFPAWHDRFSAMTMTLRRAEDRVPVYVAPRGSAVFDYVVEREGGASDQTRSELFDWIRQTGQGFENADVPATAPEPFQFTWGSRTWLVGRASGSAFNAVRGFPDRPVDEWAAAEIAALRRAAVGGRAWLLFHKRDTPDALALLQTVRAIGGRIESEEISGRDAVILVTFPVQP